MTEKWEPLNPERVHGERTAQTLLVGSAGENIDFDGWNKMKYIRALLKSPAAKDALSKYQLLQFTDLITSEPGQYFIDPYLADFSTVLEKYRSNDTRTMYVGVTSLNIYSGDNNYVFSRHTGHEESRASILSYHMMLAKTLSAEFESRTRLTDRIAKELVPASLIALSIARSTDPECPYSYSDGVERLDEKTMKLSKSVKAALEKFKL